MTYSQGRTDVEELDGFIIIDKPKGPTSHQIDYWVRQILGVSKVGHIGTLDPNATGVLVMAIGRSTKLIDIAHEEPKEYVGVMRLYADVEEEKVREVFKEYTTEIYQIPPMRAAVARILRKRRIYELELIEMRGRLVLFRVRCDSGTYIRTLCTDMGYTLGTGAQMADLRRTSTGPFTEERMVTLQELSDAVYLKKSGDDKMFRRMLLSPDSLFKNYSKIVAKKSSLDTIAHGSDLFPGGIKAIIGSPVRGERVCVVSEDNELVGTGKMLVSLEDIGDLKVVDFDRIVIEPSKPVKKPIEVKKEHKPKKKREFKEERPQKHRDKKKYGGKKRSNKKRRRR